MKLIRPEQVIELTPLNPYDRLPDGRPRVPDEFLERMKKVTLEQAWHVLNEHGYTNQSDGTFLNLHPERVMVGRALTATMVPRRSDLNDIVLAQGKSEGRHGPPNAWVIDMAGSKDVVVVDIFGKVVWGTFIGDNLGAAVRASGGAGLVLDGGIRDTQRVYDLPDINVFCRGFDGSHLRETTLASVNGTTRIGMATVLPGDVVLGTRAGLIFIPPHLVEEVLADAEEVNLRDQFAQVRIGEGEYNSGQIDVRVWADEIEADYQEWRKSHAS